MKSSNYKISIVCEYTDDSQVKRTVMNEEGKTVFTSIHPSTGVSERNDPIAILERYLNLNYPTPYPDDYGRKKEQVLDVSHYSLPDVFPKDAADVAKELKSIADLFRNSRVDFLHIEEQGVKKAECSRMASNLYMAASILEYLFSGEQ